MDTGRYRKSALALCIRGFFSATSVGAVEVLLDGPGKFLDGYPVFDQGANATCYAEAAAPLLDQYRLGKNSTTFARNFSSPIYGAALYALGQTRTTATCGAWKFFKTRMAYGWVCETINEWVRRQSTMKWAELDKQLHHKMSWSEPSTKLPYHAKVFEYYSDCRSFLHNKLLAVNINTCPTCSPYSPTYSYVDAAPYLYTASNTPESDLSCNKFEHELVQTGNILGNMTWAVGPFNGQDFALNQAQRRRLRSIIMSDADAMTALTAVFAQFSTPMPVTRPPHPTTFCKSESSKTKSVRINLIKSQINAGRLLAYSFRTSAFTADAKNVKNHDNHVMVIAGYRCNGGANDPCEYFMRNSWGKNCPSQFNRAGINCSYQNSTVGSFWVPENIMLEGYQEVSYLDF